MFKKNIQYLGFNDLWFTIAGVIILGLLIPLIFFGVKIGDPDSSFPLEWLEATIYSGTYWLVNRAIIVYFRKRYPTFEMTRKRVFLVIIFCLVIVSLVGIILTPTLNVILNFCSVDNPPPSPIQGLSATFTATFFVMAVYESIWYYSQLKKSIQEQEQVKVAHVQSQLDGLRNQVNPHFLFNSLNTLNHIVEYEDKALAKKFINQLSKVYRYILDSREESIISLEEELDFVKAYVSIQKERFLENLQIDINIPSQYLQKKVIPLSLQLLIENAIKHNIISTKKPLQIRIDIDEAGEWIKVTNTLQKRSKVLHSTKVGLQNIKERYRLLSEEKSVIIQEMAADFSVSIPLLQ